MDIIGRDCEDLIYKYQHNLYMYDLMKELRGLFYGFGPRISTKGKKYMMDEFRRKRYIPKYLIEEDYNHGNWFTAKS